MFCTVIFLLSDSFPVLKFLPALLSYFLPQFFNTFLLFAFLFLFLFLDFVNILLVVLDSELFYFSISLFKTYGATISLPASSSSTKISSDFLHYHRINNNIAKKMCTSLGWDTMYTPRPLMRKAMMGMATILVRKCLSGGFPRAKAMMPFVFTHVMIISTI